MEQGNGNGDHREGPTDAAVGPNLVATLDALLQKHHDRLVQSLQVRPLPPMMAASSLGKVGRIASSKGGSLAAGRTRRSSADVMLRQRSPPKDSFNGSVVTQQRSAAKDASNGSGVTQQRSTSKEGTTEGPHCDKEVSFQPGIETAPTAYLDDDEEGSGEADDNRDLNSVESAESTFSQSEKMKRIQSLSIPRQRPGPLSKSHSRVEEGFEMAKAFSGGCKEGVQSLVTANWFEMLMSLLIMSNALFCGAEVEYLAQAKTDESPPVFNIIGTVYACIFAFELLLRGVAEGRNFFWKPNWKWNYFDLMIVITSMLEVSVGTGENGGSRQLPSIRVIRMARVVRVLRIARIMRHFRSLRILIYSVLNTLRSLFWTMVLLALILYVFGILFTQATTQHLLYPDAAYIPKLEHDYGTVGRSVFTLFKAITGGVSWQEITEPLGALHPVWVGFYFIYFSFTYFAVLNVVTGVFCQTAIESANHDQEMAAQAQMSAKQLYIKQLNNIFGQININDDNEITLQEFEDGMKDEKLKAYFASIDISVDEAFSLFKLLDHEEAHVLDIDTFVTGCLKLRGQAKSIDIAMMMYETRWKLRKCFEAIKSIEDKFQIFQEWLIPARGPSAMENSMGFWHSRREDEGELGKHTQHENGNGLGLSDRNMVHTEII